jgi:Domain of unknown function (DUF4386)
MSTAVRMERIQGASPRFVARAAGVLYVLSVATAVFSEFFAPGRLGDFAAIAVPVSCQVAVTLLVYVLFQPVNRRLCLLAVFLNLVGLGFEALRWQPRGMDIAMVFHAIYCLLLGYLIFRSTFLPRILGLLMGFAGLVWLVYLSPELANRVSPYNSACGLLGEAVPMLWLLVMGVNLQRWKELASAAEEQR